MKDKPTKPVHQGFERMAVSAFLNERDVYQRFVEELCKDVGSEVGYLHHYDEASNQVSLGVWTTKVLEMCQTVHNAHYSLTEAGIWADSIRQRIPVVHNHYQDMARADALPAGHFAVSNHASFPIEVNGRIEAVVGIGEVDSGFDDGKVARVQQLVHIGWPIVADKLRDLTQREAPVVPETALNSPFDILNGMLGVITSSLELRDEYTAAHQHNVTRLCMQIADCMALPDTKKQGLEIGASIHDIGKIGMPTSLLSKPGKLNPAEYNLLKTHAEQGAKLFEKLVLPWPIKEMIAQHHERMDGSGYPQGLMGGMICDEARIIAVADTFDAMASDRPYRSALGPEAAIKVLTEGRGKYFDAEVVDAFMQECGDDVTFGGRYRMVR